MVISFLVLWVFISSIIASYMYWFNQHKKSTMKLFIKRAAIAGIAGIVIISVLMLINNVSGL
jgi:CHASE2 domain-containing sensor protein